MAKQTFARDWVFNVILPFLRQLKNRMNNIRVEDDKFYNENNEPTPLKFDVYYSNRVDSDNYGQEDGNKPFKFSEVTSDDRGIEVSQDQKSFRVLKDSVVSITIQEGLLVSRNGVVSIKLRPLNGDARSDYDRVFDIYPNIKKATDNLFKRYAYMNQDSWTSVFFEWNNITLKAGEWVTLEIEGITSDDAGLDGGAFGHINIQGSVK